MVNLEDYFSYDSESGIITWKVSVNSRTKIGQKVKSKDKNGYLRVGLFGKTYKAHRLAWFLFYGEWPKKYIDHINGDPADNRISNLREATPKQNAYNRKLGRSNTSGVKGISYHKRDKKWMATIEKDDKCIFIGYFSSIKSAKEALEYKRNEVHGDFANHG